MKTVFFILCILACACDALYVRISENREIELVDLQRYYTDAAYREEIDSGSEAWPTVHVPRYNEPYEVSYSVLVDAQQMDARWMVSNWIRSSMSFPGRGDIVMTVDVSDLAVFVETNRSLLFSDIETSTLRYMVEMISLDHTFPDMQIEGNGMTVTFVCARADELTFKVCSGVDYKFIAAIKP
jgi:hypothetical protein